MELGLGSCTVAGELWIDHGAVNEAQRYLRHLAAGKAGHWESCFGCSGFRSVALLMNLTIQ